MAKTLICPNCGKADMDPEHVWEGCLKIKCSQCGEWGDKKDWKTVQQLQSEVKELRELERSYTHQLGEMARLCDIVCTWVLECGGNHAYPPTEVMEATNEITDYVESVRPGSTEPRTEWFMHVLGPDDVFPCVGEFDALRKANQHNRSWARLMAEDPKPNDPYCVAVAVTKESI